MTRSMRGEIGSRVVSRTSGFCKKFVSLKQQQADPAVATPHPIQLNFLKLSTIRDSPDSLQSPNLFYNNKI